METFLVYKLNQAEREKDQSKLWSLGPYAKLLDKISISAQLKRNDSIDS